MVTDPPKEITQLLLAWREGDRTAFDRLVPLVYAELHALARRYINAESVGHIMQATALINEAYLRLIDQRRMQWQNRAQFFGIASQLMRRILVDMARVNRCQKRGGGAPITQLNEMLVISQEHDVDLVALDDALTKLASIDERKARVVELRFFGGLSVEETAEVLSISTDTVGRDWIAAKALLANELRPNTKR
jgi:RNA polymerase sigma-70 factor, ECF subfamily